ncbi:hypothetical protein [Actinokineospora terrae]|uniref:Uncharacterized protein n=1 Tax=Actinokineospora terrae TaxID=155974 RepID=A0A1H9VW04_9PSEU|nr:hypothetical protein [Actinokineospora terrae]SES25855.1 hypothetical protein SAMN04487818_109132 [Actinokineospora terrae]
MPNRTEIVLVHWANASRAARQSADVLLSERQDRERSRQWAERALAEFPGCLVAAAHHDGGLVAVARLHSGRPLWIELTGPVDTDLASAAATALGEVVA